MFSLVPATLGCQSWVFEWRAVVIPNLFGVPARLINTSIALHEL